MQVKPSAWLSAVFCLSLMQSAFAADVYSGKFTGPTLSVELSFDNAGYTGNIHLAQQAFPLKAHEEAGQLQGTFASNGNDFAFNATLKDDTLTLTTGGATYTLKKEAQPANPLAAAAANPLAAAAANDGPPGYTVINSTDSGKALSAAKPDATSVMAAMKATFPDLEKFFGYRPKILGVRVMGAPR